MPVKFGTPGDFRIIDAVKASDATLGFRPQSDAPKAPNDAGELPDPEVDGDMEQYLAKIYATAQERFLVREFGFGGSTPFEFAEIDAIAEKVRDIKDAYSNAMRDKEGAQKDSALTAWFDTTLPAQVKMLEAMVPGEAGPFLFGDKVSYADISVFQFLAAQGRPGFGGFFDNAEAAAPSFKDCPKIKSAMDAVAAMPEVIAWIEKRPNTPMHREKIPSTPM